MESHDELLFRQRLTELRIKKDRSEYQMSTDLGHSNSYVRSITCGRSLPAMREFFYICEYFGISPGEYFDYGTEDPAQIRRLTAYAKQLSQKNLETLIEVARCFEASQRNNHNG